MSEQEPTASLLPPEHQERVASYLRLLAPSPPSCLLLEGGTRQQREDLALFWAALLNCSGQTTRPCSRCRECEQLACGVFRELYWLRGEEGPVKIDAVRAFRRSMAEKMSQGSVRVFVVSEAQELTSSAANGLLKSLEEPLPGNVFLLLAPQRSFLLPTLVSRSYLFTLGWAPAQGESESVSIWMERLLGFWAAGEGLFAFTGKKGEVDKDTLRELIVALQQRLLQSLLGDPGDECASLLQQRTGPEAKMRLQEGLSKAHWAVQHQVNPSLVLDWIALEVWSCLEAAERS
jgi:DNA polymerase-3 subunit delta'